ncbi:alpha/beta hydrolase [Dinoroseobacter sp. PD6]|uniref:alpha/beta hydrolase n=1 Tax=Dinoroseobacter sp. PD6 TaxID=3028384 RepID=UPI00237B8898|nr:alpha/beta hydrolase [Dinoroseobacter sp. PD6]MDD9717794.1 alpha/beta hydrolase [Dinoroseobacter sp. PD6]
MSWIRWLVLALSLVAVTFSVWRLEGMRAGIEITRDAVGPTPVTVYRLPDAGPAPAVVIAHGFAGSMQLMEAFALTLAQAGYVAVSFDFEGHGRNPVPMSGDVTRIDGTTQLLMSETGRVTDYALALPGVDGRVALLGHSMASDVIVRQTIADPRVSATVAISMFSQAVNAEQPSNLIAINGAWEAMLREEARRVIRLIDPDAEEGQTVQAGDVVRRAVASPNVEHVGVLYSATSLQEARDWLDRSYGRNADTGLATTGGWIVLLLAGLVGLVWPVAGLLPRGPVPALLPRRDFAVALGVASLVTPLILWPVEIEVLPVLVADYLALHLLVFGAIACGYLLWRGHRPGGWQVVPGLALALYGTFVFGGALDRYVASFMPHAGRIPIIAAIAVGAVAFMLADTWLSGAGRAPLWRKGMVKLGFFASLGLAVALDFEGLFFLLIILPVILLYFAVFGTMAGWAGRRSGAVGSIGVGLGLVLAWSLGVTFPMFAL